VIEQEPLATPQEAVDSLFALLAAHSGSRSSGKAVETGLTGRVTDLTGFEIVLLGAALSSKYSEALNQIWQRTDEDAVSVSEEDWALENELAYQVIRAGVEGDEIARTVERIMRSGPYRSKWDEARNGVSWLAQDIANAVQTVKDRLKKHAEKYPDIETSDLPKAGSNSQAAEPTVLDEEDWEFHPKDSVPGEAAPKNGSAASDTPTSAPTAPRPPQQPKAAKDGPQWPLTDTGNGERLVARYGRDMRFCAPWSCWLYWDGARWKRDDINRVRSWTKPVARNILAEALPIQDKELRSSVIDWCRRSESTAARTAMLKAAESEHGIPVLPSDMDTHLDLLSVENGTIDLRTGQLKPHDRNDVITKLAPVRYDPAATCPTFLTFLERVVPDPDVREFLQRAVGYSLTGQVCEQCLFFLYGGGANGKSTLLTVLQALLGDYARQAAPELLVTRGGDRHPTELADLFGARAVMSIEVDEGKRLAETLVKQMTGGDKMKARFMRADFFEWTPTHKLFLAANHRPAIKGTDYAIWRRIHLIPFTVTIPKDERDGKLPAKLMAELSGILNWAVAGCLDWQKNGLGVPQAVEDATNEYRQEQDVIGEFLTERCVRDAQARDTSKRLWEAWKSWCEDNGEKEGTQKAFGLKLSERGFTQARTKSGRFWQGIRLRGPDEGPSGDAFEDGDAWCRDFPHKSNVCHEEDVIGKNASSRVTEENASPEDDVDLCGTCGSTPVDMVGLDCDDCLEAGR
jgi:P4 family phage/plasmid primase-like protien